MKPSLLILPLVAALAVGTASAENGDRQGPKNGNGQGPPNGDRAEEMAKRLIEKHDANSDGALDEAELTEALKAMHKHRMQQRGPGKGKGPGDRPNKPERRGKKPADNAE
jgi:hypothetical protein